MEVTVRQQQCFEQLAAQQEQAEQGKAQLLAAAQCTPLPAPHHTAYQMLNKMIPQADVEAYLCMFEVTATPVGFIHRIVSVWGSKAGLLLLTFRSNGRLWPAQNGDPGSGGTVTRVRCPALPCLVIWWTYHGADPCHTADAPAHLWLLADELTSVQ